MIEIAIVGMGAVFPGAGNAPAFWRNICSGTDAITDVPPDRWDPAVYCPQEEEAGADRFYCRRGGFLGELASRHAQASVVFLDNEAHPERVVVRMR